MALCEFVCRAALSGLRAGQCCGRAEGFLSFVGCLTFQEHASQGQVCSDDFTCCHTEIEVADLTFHVTQSLYTDTGPTSPSTDPITPGAWQGSHWSAIFFKSHRYDSTPDKSRCKRDSNSGSSALEADALTTRPTRRSSIGGSCRSEHKRVKTPRKQHRRGVQIHWRQETYKRWTEREKERDG